MKDYQCESCGAIYTTESNMPPVMSCICKSRSFKVTKQSILSQAN